MVDPDIVDTRLEWTQSQVPAESMGLPIVKTPVGTIGTTLKIENTPEFIEFTKQWKRKVDEARFTLEDD